MTGFEKDHLMSTVASVSKVVTNPYEKFKMVDNGGRRSGGDRRNYSYSIHLPERRAKKDRRDCEDRRRFPRYKCG